MKMSMASLSANLPILKKKKQIWDKIDKFNECTIGAQCSVLIISGITVKY